MREEEIIQNGDHEGECVVCHNKPDGEPRKLGPCNICISCDAEMGGEGVKVLAEQAEKKTEKKIGLNAA
jgi:hypothetical protein